MSSILDEIEALVNELALVDLLEKNVFQGRRLYEICDTLEKKKAHFQREWEASPVYRDMQRKDREAYAKRVKTANEKRERRVKWCEENIKLGDIVRVTGTVSNKVRKVIGIGEQKYGDNKSIGLIRNCAVDLLTGREWTQTTTTYMSSITHKYNPETKMMEKIDDLIRSSDSKRDS